MSDLGNEKSDPSQKEQNITQTIEDELTLNNGEVIKLPSLQIDHMTLFFGSRTSGKTEIREADETTIGNGLYATSSKEAAAGYATVRSSDPKQRIIYTLEIGNMKILDLTSREAIDSFAKLMRQIAINKQGKLKSDNEFTKWHAEEQIRRTIEVIDQKKYRGLKDITFWFGDWIRTTLSNLGYDGLKAFEGGEGGNGVTIGKHDSYVIFDPKRAKVIKEEPAQLPTN